ncbi:MAG: hypothetical protein PHZ26_01240 [Candidatus Gracilibacteria bacterium]|nr:hypothetical protein [Candidatus Gracilibacteria bacterium]MDD2908359.1 hypothetical protein [Candidatus Gracilibacteria bacterium]
MDPQLQKQVFAYIKGEIELGQLLETEPNYGEIHKILLYIYKNTKFVAKEKMYKNFIILEEVMTAKWEKYNKIITNDIDSYYKFKNQYLPKKKKKVIKKGDN